MKDLHPKATERKMLAFIINYNGGDPQSTPLPILNDSGKPNSLRCYFKKTFESYLLSSTNGKFDKSNALENNSIKG